MWGSPAVLHGEDGTHSTDQPGGSGWLIHEAQISSKSSGTHPAKIYYNKPEYSNTQQDLPDYWYILSRLLKCRAFWLCSSFAEKPLLLGPYFHSLAQVELTATTRFVWISKANMVEHIILSRNHSHKSNFHLSVFPIFTMMRLIDQGSHIRESRRIDPI